MLLSCRNKDESLASFQLQFVLLWCWRGGGGGCVFGVSAKDKRTSELLVPLLHRLHLIPPDCELLR